MNAPGARASLVDLWQEIEAAYARARRDHPAALACRAGCADCCVAGIEIGVAEAEAVEAWIAALAPAGRERVRALAERERGVSCALLDDEMACSIYEARPIVCRAFGLPMRVHELEGDRRRLPIFGVTPPGARVVDSCNKNFIGVDLERVHPGAIVDALGLSKRAGGQAGERKLLLDVVRAALATAERQDPPSA